MNIIASQQKEIPTFSSLSEKLASNVASVQNASVVIFLVNHQNSSHSKAIRSHLSGIQALSKSILLVEDPDELEEWNKMLPAVCWESKETLSWVLEKKKTFQLLKESISHLSDPEFPLIKKQRAVKQTLLNAKILKLISEENVYSKRIGSFLAAPETYKVQLQEEEATLKGWVDKIYKTFVSQTIEKTIAVRQSCLINCIQKYCRNQEERPEKIYVICGSSHGNPHGSAFPGEVERFHQYLEKETNFYIYSLN